MGLQPTGNAAGAAPVNWKPGMPAPDGYRVSPDGQSLINVATGGTAITGSTVNGTAVNATNPQGNAIVDAVASPVVGGISTVADLGNAGLNAAGVEATPDTLSRLPGDIAYGSTGGTVGNNDGPTQGSVITPHAIGQTVDAAGNAIGDAAGAVGGAVGSAVDALGNVFGGPSGGPTPQSNPGADFRAQQLAYAKSLQDTINGTAGPSAADIQGHQAQDRAIAQQFAAAQGATGANSALAYRQALQNAAGISQQAGADAATLRAKEVADAQSQLGTGLASARNADLSQYATDVGAGNTRYAADKDFQGKAIGAGAGAASGIVGALVSDKDKKTDVAPGDAEVAAMLDKLKAHTGRYKNPSEPGAAPGRRAMVMAQDLEKSMAGKALVIDTPDGKTIDSPQAIGAMLAALASLHGRMKAVEGRR
jgi:hypothetical protein